MKLLISLLSLISSLAFSYPENIRKSRKCVACHVSPSGAGGLLTPYGRGSSNFMYSWHTKSETKAAWGMMHSSEALVGANFKYLFTRNANFPMQADASLGLRFPKFTLAISGGQYRDSSESRQHYAMINHKGVFFRVGRFAKTYGLNIADHTSFIKSDLGLGQGSETYQAEIHYIHPLGQVTLAGNLQGVNGRVEYFITPRWKIGLSGEYKRVVLDTNVFSYGLYLAGGNEAGTYFLFETDYHIEQEPLKFRQFAVAYGTLGHYIYSGVGIHIGRQVKYDGKIQKDKVTAGIKLLPRPRLTILIDSGVIKYNNQDYEPFTALILGLWL